MNTINAATAAAETPAATPIAAAAATTAASTLPPSTPTTGTISMNAKVAINFLGSSPDSQLIIATGHIVDSMTGNTSYPAPIPALATVVAARNSYVTAVNALDRSKASTIQRNQTRAALVVLLRDLALYVQHTCAGNVAVLLSSGYPAQKPRRQPSAVLAAPQKVVLRRARVSGQILARCKAVDNASAYQWRFATTAAPTAWTQPDPVTTASYTLANLVPGTSYLVQVRALGTRGPSNWSDSATLMSV